MNYPGSMVGAEMETETPPPPEYLLLIEILARAAFKAIERGEFREPEQAARNEQSEQHERS